MLGHSRISTTLDLYSHVTPDSAEQATEAQDAVRQAQLTTEAAFAALTIERTF